MGEGWFYEVQSNKRSKLIYIDGADANNKEKKAAEEFLEEYPNDTVVSVELNGGAS